VNGLVVMAMVALTGCATLGAPSYELGDGDANYDALNAATKTCEAEGGVVKLKSGGYDNRQLSSYLCVGGKAN
jgi:hypothetical protein